MTIHTNIQGVFRLTSPMHVAAAGDFGLNEEGRVVPGKTKQNCLATMHQRILVDGVFDDIPFFPANDLRGRLRRKAAGIVMDALVAMGQKIPVDLYAGLSSGAANARPESDLTIEEAMRARRHVYMGLFGGGTRLLRSGYSAQDAIPMVGSTVKAGLVPKDFGDYAHKPIPASGGEDSVFRGDRWKLTDVRHTLRVDDVTRVLRPADLDKYLADAAKEVGEFQAKTMENRKARKEDKEAAQEDKEGVKKSDVGNVVSIQSIIPGVELYARFDMQDHLSDAQIGLFLNALLALVNERALGGWIRAGFGRFEATDFSLTVGGEKMAIFTQLENGEYQLSEALEGYISAMREEISALKVDDLMDFFAPKKADKEKSAKQS